MTESKWRSSAVLLLLLDMHLSNIGCAQNGLLIWTVEMEGPEWPVTPFPVLAFPDDEVIMLGTCDDTCPVYGAMQLWAAEDLQLAYSSTDLGKTWEVRPRAPWPGRRGMAAILVDGNIVMMSGYDDSRGFNDVWMSTDRSLTWKVQSSSAPWDYRSEGGLVLVGSTILFFGGVGPAAKGLLNDVWRSNNSGVSWTRATASADWSPRTQFGASVNGQEVLVIGGKGADGYFDDVWASGDLGATWSLRKSGVPFGERSQFGCVKMTNGSIVIIGGQGFMGATNDIWMGSPDGAEWSLMQAAAPFSKRGILGSTILNNNRYLLLGGALDTYSKDVWLSGSLIATTTTTTTTTATTSTLSTTTSTTSTTTTATTTTSSNTSITSTTTTSSTTSTSTTTSSTTTSTTTTTTSTSTTTSQWLYPLKAGQRFRYYKFLPIATRSDTDQSRRLVVAAPLGVHLSEIEFRSGGSVVSLEGAVATNPGGNYDSSGLPSFAIDGNYDTKWYDFNRMPLIVDFPQGMHVDHIRFATAADRPLADPVSWQVEASDDLHFWIALEINIDYPTPIARRSWTPWFDIRQVVRNFGFERGSSTLSYEISQTIPDWLVAGSVVFIRSWDSTWCSIEAAEGDYFLGLQGRRSAITQSIPLVSPGAAYWLSFQTARCPDAPAATLRVIVNGDEMMRFIPSATSFETFKIYFEVSKDFNGQVDVEFRNAGTGSDEIVFIDDVVIAETTLTTTTSTTSTTTTTTTTTTTSTTTTTTLEIVVEEESDNSGTIALAVVGSLFFVAISLCVWYFCCRSPSFSCCQGKQKASRRSPSRSLSRSPSRSPTKNLGKKSASVAAFDPI